MLMKSLASSLSMVLPCVLVSFGNVPKVTSSTNVQAASNHEEKTLNNTDLMSVITANFKSVKGIYNSRIGVDKLAQATGRKTYYVSGSGDDSNDGLTKTTAFRTLQEAADKVSAGDTVYVMNGTYTQKTDPNKAILNIYQKQGTATAPITFKAYSNHKPVLKSSNNWTIAIAGSSYINIEGLTLVGSNDLITLEYAKQQKNNLNNPLTNGAAIIVSKTSSYPSHHIVIRNNNISKFGGGGVSTAKVDYITIENNVISETCLYTPLGGNPISTVHNHNLDNNTTAYKMIIRGNIVYNNISYIPWYINTKGEVTEGHGIIIDDTMNTQATSTHQPYTGKTLIANNIVYNNGGSGIAVFKSANVDVVNNTTYQNVKSPDQQKHNLGEINALRANQVRVFNNIMYPTKDGVVNNTNNSTNIIYDNNLVYNSTKYKSSGLSNIIGKDPQFVNRLKGDFSLKFGSFAIDSGISTYNGAAAPKTDRLGISRPQDGDGNGIGIIDMGALERKL
jgi:hypothetical protein